MRKIPDRRRENEEDWIAGNEDKGLRASIGGLEGRNRNRGARAQTPNLAVPISVATRSALQYYTYGDAFCGAGGMTRGAYMAGLKIMWGLDADEHAAKTWGENFSFAALYEMWADEFLGLPDNGRRFVVDILHLSPPCQFFSPAKRFKGGNDEHNTSSMFVVEQFLRKARPRIVTLEETYGLLERHKEYFNALIKMFTSQGFSIGWQKVDMQRFGVPQTRKRLIVTASCPGETLPDFMAPTHSLNGHSGLLPFVDAKRIVRSVPRNAENHDIKLPTGKIRPKAWEAEQLVTGTITCQGPISHPDGDRFLTSREVATLQTFDHDYVFKKVERHRNANVDRDLQARGYEKSKTDPIRAQIGNAVPAVYGCTLYKHIIQHLRMVDREAARF